MKDVDAPIRPVTTQPMVGEIENRCVTVEGSRSLSYNIFHIVSKGREIAVRRLKHII